MDDVQDLDQIVNDKFILYSATDTMGAWGYSVFNALTLEEAIFFTSLRRIFAYTNKIHVYGRLTWLQGS